MEPVAPDIELGTEVEPGMPAGEVGEPEQPSGTDPAETDQSEMEGPEKRAGGGPAVKEEPVTNPPPKLKEDKA